MKYTSIAVVAVIILAVVAAAAFYAGVHYNPLSNSFSFSNYASRTPPPGPNKGIPSPPTIGAISNKTATGFTLKDPSGKTTVVNVTASTTLYAIVAAGQSAKTYTQLSDGDIVAVTGTTNPDGSVSAQSLQLLPPPPPARPTR